MNDEYKKMLERFEQICQNAKKELCCKNEKEQERKFIEKIDKELTISEYDEIEYWLANIEVLDNTDYILNNRKAKILVRYLKEKKQEIERLCNILDNIGYQIEGIIRKTDDIEINKATGEVLSKHNIELLKEILKMIVNKDVSIRGDKE